MSVLNLPVDLDSKTELMSLLFFRASFVVPVAIAGVQTASLYHLQISHRVLCLLQKQGGRVDNLRRFVCCLKIQVKQQQHQHQCEKNQDYSRRHTHGSMIKT
ncbi:MAG: hypothetical protein GY744_10855 [Gammaproteobacteria bacterium]|nr:hypothetical protein [Gammaproteobacteria bacterium]